MIFRIGDASTPYYAGLNLVALANLAFVPWTIPFYISVISLIFGPFYLIAFHLVSSTTDLKGLFVNSFFIVSTVAMLFFIRLFNETVRSRAIFNRITYERGRHERQSSEERLLIARQVAHDIRSPLSALRILSAKLASDVRPELSSLLSATTERIDDVASDLLRRFSSQEEAVIVEPQLVELTEVLSKIITEKRADVRISSGQIHLQFENYHSSTHGRCVASQLERILSNVINNSIEAIQANGLIKVDLTTTESTSTITIKDSGKGISESIIDKLGYQMLSVGKNESGHGMALWSARQWIETWGGTLQIASTEGDGTTIKIALSAGAQIEDSGLRD